MPIWNPCCRRAVGRPCVVCACGQTSQQWSVSQGAAIRAWNRNLAQENDLASLSKERMTPQSHLKS
jgi:hypothetical protein